MVKFRSCWAALRSFFGRGAGEGGADATEFALFAPVICYALLATVDIGMALHERMAMQHVLRQGAQAAMVDPGEDPVRDVLDETADKNFVLASEGEGDTYSSGAAPISVAVDRFCACPAATRTEVDCSTSCAGTVPTFIYYAISASKDYDGIFLPRIDLGASLHVQVR